jgi:hypothetical protein
MCFSGDFTRTTELTSDDVLDRCVSVNRSLWKLTWQPSILNGYHILPCGQLNDVAARDQLNLQQWAFYIHLIDPYEWRHTCSA